MAACSAVLCALAAPRQADAAPRQADAVPRVAPPPAVEGPQLRVFPEPLVPQFQLNVPRQRATPMVVERVRRMWDPAVVEQVTLPKPLLECIARLDDAKYAVRDRASSELESGTFPLEEIVAALVRGQLSPEQHARLVAAACTRALALPRGALGIRMQSSMDRVRPGVEISMLLPGMPAERVLRPGDRIELIGDIPVQASDQLVSMIQSRVPGDTVRLTVARARRDERGRIEVGDDGMSIEDRVEVEVELADAAELERFEARLPSAGAADWREAVVQEIRSRFPARESQIPLDDSSGLPGRAVPPLR